VKKEKKGKPDPADVADEGGFDLSRFPAVQAWLARVKAQPGHVPITQR